MKNKGFTLVELLGVIIVLGVIASITFVSINNILKTQKDEAYKIQIDNIISGAKTWAGENVMSLPSNEGEFVIISLQQLKDLGFVKKDIKNPKNNQLFSNSIKIKIIRKENDYVYEIEGDI